MEKLYMIEEPNKSLSDAALQCNLHYYATLAVEHHIKYMDYDEKSYLIKEELRLREMQRMNKEMEDKNDGDKTTILDTSLDN